MKRNNKGDSKPLRDTKIGRWLSQNAPDILNVAGELSPVGGNVLRFVADKVAKKQELSSEQLERFEEIHREMQAEISERWKSDMNSDSWLPKNIRPLTLAILLLSFFVIVIFDSIDYNGFNVSESYISMLEVLMTTVFTAYFAGRSFEKIKR